MAVSSSFLNTSNIPLLQFDSSKFLVLPAEKVVMHILTDRQRPITIYILHIVLSCLATMLESLLHLLAITSYCPTVLRVQEGLLLCGVLPGSLQSQSQMLGAGATEEKGETARMVSSARKNAP